MENKTKKKKKKIKNRSKIAGTKIAGRKKQEKRRRTRRKELHTFTRLLFPNHHHPIPPYEMSIIILTAVQRTSSINVVKEIAKTVLEDNARTSTDILLLLLFFFPPSSPLRHEQWVEETYGNPFLPLSSFYSFSSSLLLFLFPAILSKLNPNVSRVRKRGKLGGERGNEDEERPHKTISHNFPVALF